MEFWWKFHKMTVPSGRPRDCTIPYIRSIINGKTKPHQLSWLVFSIMNGVCWCHNSWPAGGSPCSSRSFSSSAAPPTLCCR
jgi:hypothetical protein